jgi:hypothetical protein
MAKLQKNLASINAKMRLLVPKKVSEDDKLIEYDALLLDRFLGILQGLHGDDVRETVIIIISSIILAISSQKLYAKHTISLLLSRESLSGDNIPSRMLQQIKLCVVVSIIISLSIYYCLSVFRVTGVRNPFSQSRLSVIGGWNLLPFSQCLSCDRRNGVFFRSRSSRTNHQHKNTIAEECGGESESRLPFSRSSSHNQQHKNIIPEEYGGESEYFFKNPNSRLID